MESTNPADKATIVTSIRVARETGSLGRDALDGFLKALRGALRRRAGKVRRGVPTTVAESDDLVSGIYLEIQKDLNSPGRLKGAETYDQIIGRYTRLMKWRLLDLIRRKGREEPLRDSTGAHPVDDRPGPDDARKRQTVLDAIEALPEELRRVVKLVYLQGKSNTDAAREIGVDESTIRRRLNKGLAVLRPTLAEFSSETSE